MIPTIRIRGYSFLGGRRLRPGPCSLFLKKAYNRVTTLIEQRGGECAVMRAYVLVEATVRGAKVASEKILALELADTKIVAADIVTGPTDVIVRLESHDLEALGHAIAAIQQVEGVNRTTTCLAITLWQGRVP